MGDGGHAIFGQKLLNTLLRMDRCARKSHIMKWTNMLSLKKKSLKPNTASHTTTSWYTDTDGFLEHSPSGEGLYKGPIFQKIILFWGSPLRYVYFMSVSHCLNFCSPFRNWKVCVFCLFFFQIALAVSGPLQLHMSFRISLSISVKVKAAGMFPRVWLISDQFGECAVVMVLKLPSHFHLFI